MIFSPLKQFLQDNSDLSDKMVYAVSNKGYGDQEWFVGVVVAYNNDKTTIAIYDCLSGQTVAMDGESHNMFAVLPSPSQAFGEVEKLALTIQTLKEQFGKELIGRQLVLVDEFRMVRVLGYIKLIEPTLGGLDAESGEIIPLTPEKKGLLVREE